jgi:transitional endoplasmic reticulum ATPase
MSIKQAIELLTRRMAFEEEDVIVHDTFDTFPWDGAVALQRVLKKRFGWADAVGIPGMFGKTPPQLISVETGPGHVQQVPWGRFTLPVIEGFIQTGSQRNNKGRLVFSLGANVKRKSEDYVRGLYDEVRQEILNHSIYKGQAVKLRFLDDDGDPLDMPQVSFMDTSGISESSLVYSADLMTNVTTNLFTPIRRATDCIANGIQLKRGILLGGTYGCGKTLAAVVASKIAVDNGITFIYAERANELGQAVEFAKQYQSPAAVVFCEDIDRSMSGNRSVEMDEILNIVDGIESKRNNIIVVLTTNNMEAINDAMLRPGRLDAVINVTPPDAAAVEKLLRLYGGRAIDKDTDLSAVGRQLAGNIPAVIAEVVKRAKLHQLSHQLQGTQVTELGTEALSEAAKSMTHQISLLNRGPKAEAPPLEKSLADVVHRAMQNGAADGILHQIDRRVRDVQEWVENQ